MVLNLRWRTESISNALSCSMHLVHLVADSCLEPPAPLSLLEGAAVRPFEPEAEATAMQTNSYGALHSFQTLPMPLDPLPIN